MGNKTKKDQGANADHASAANDAKNQLRNDKDLNRGQPLTEKIPSSSLKGKNQ